MPVEIKELNLKINIGAQEEEAGDGSLETAEGAADDRGEEQLIERLRFILETTKKRRFER